MTELAPHLPADLLTVVVDAAIAITDEGQRARALTGLAPHLRADQRPRVLAAAMEYPASP